MPQYSTESITGLVSQAFQASYSYHFRAERLNIGRCLRGTSRVLATNARNLPEVIQNLQGANTARFNALCEKVRAIVPSARWIGTTPIENDVEIRVWRTAPESEREDLAIPLAQCGTGIGQVLAILYVVLESEGSRSIFIDEPNAFLHPRSRSCQETHRNAETVPSTPIRNIDTFPRGNLRGFRR